MLARCVLHGLFVIYVFSVPKGALAVVNLSSPRSGLEDCNPIVGTLGNRVTFRYMYKAVMKGVTTLLDISGKKMKKKKKSNVTSDDRSLGRLK